jgi:NADH dehydrogenase/NADH:ubiquinone oxidoreductase subunit G
LEAASWDQALDKAAEVIKERGFSLSVGPEISNEALWILNSTHRALGGAPARSMNPWPMKGAFSSLMGCRVIVLVGLDAWQELPILALWIRRAVQAGARLVVIGPDNGLARETAHWIRVAAGAEGAAVHDLLTDVTGVSSEQNVPDGTLAAVLDARPVAVLVGPRLASDARASAEIATLAERLGAVSDNAPSGLLMTGANDRGAHDLAPGVSLPASDERATVAFGAVKDVDSTITAGWRASGDQDALPTVVLPLTHPYEQDGSFTNLEGRVQTFRSAARAPGQARPDWEVAALLALRLGVDVPVTLAGIRAEIAAHVAAYADVFPLGEEELAHA